MPSGEPSLHRVLEHARQLLGLSNPADILVQTCGEAQHLAGARIALGSYVRPGQAWGAGLHVLLVDGEPRAVPPEAVSAAFAVHRRLAATRGPVELERAGGPPGVFAGLSVEPGFQAGAIRAVPLLQRTGRLVGSLLLASAGPEMPALSAPVLPELAELASAALASAERLAAARRDQERLMLLAEVTEEALWDWNVSSNEVWWAGGIQELLGGDGRDVVHHELDGKFARVHPADGDRVRASLARALASMASSWKAEYRLRRRDGSWAVVEDRAHFLREADGRAYRAIGSLRDVSEEKRLALEQQFLARATTALTESLDIDRNLEKAALVAASSVADWCTILLLDPRTDEPRKVIVAHRDGARAARVRGALEAALGDAGLGIGADVQQLVPLFGDEHARALVASAPVMAEVLGEVAPRSLLSAPMRTAGRVVGAVTLVTTEESMRSYGEADRALAHELAQRCAIAFDNASLFEEAQSAIRARDEFLSIASHELKTPLTPLELQLHTLSEKIPEYAKADKQDWVAKRLGRLRRQGQRLNRLASELLDISRIIGGRLQLEPEQVDLAELVRAVVAEFRDEGALARAQSRVSVEVGAPVLGRWDRMRLEQVVTNLLSNALKYGAGKPIAVSVSTADGLAVLSVEDQGMGIDPDDQERIFGRFERAVSVHHFGGFGLGLFIVRQIVEAMGGDIQVASSPGEGARFTVRLPPRRPPETAREPAPRPGTEHAAARPLGDTGGPR